MSKSTPFNNESIKSEEDPSMGWQPFGSRRPSVISPNEDPINRLQDYAFPHSVINAATWYPDIASVPMLPEVSVEPFFREQRSMSFAYDWPVFTNTSPLDTMHEEEEEDDLLRARVRSKSVMDIWSPLKDQSRRLPLAPPPPILPTSSLSSSSSSFQMSAGDRERIRRFSLTPLTLDTHQHNHHPHRRHSLAGPTQPSTMDTLTETVESLAIQNTSSEEEMNMDDMGKGVKFDAEILKNAVFYVIEFKGGRSDIFYSATPTYKQGDLVIVEADRGRDLGKVSAQDITRLQIENFYRNNRNTEEDEKKQQEIYIKRIFRQARRDEITLLLTKGQDESKALAVCQSKIKQKKLCMQVVDAEYQW
ncbi:hypothetical protein G6F57_003272 [Rhizopus arrhizus]|uniref:PSP1 C-terminal domain-containing protein n=1 Tax=Rhizopus oryzae TaxID=64495 RepID=A0A9P7BVL4_RHIOR|nr:hypothetical protein G6F24_003574 [Rhizopus arrhizus]KAG0793979.1 hypothetical protein G6F21_003207 [Rhizopus arrhizus]KAG0802482.1 hypothetical protein G6F22_000208 [Rhizopus arrhizus]KAG0815119.1 hypothetical protein G6F20_004242 [Rhizopus arrhizus]KAG0838714.1 hypothetical protein G6F18_004404 [Rhizopus arrhizus]